MNTEQVIIVDYEPKYRSHFKQLNEAWISKHFNMEESDHKALDHPKEYILDRGGYIFVALLNEEPVGFCAMIKMEDTKYDFELAKMAVSPKAQGKGIGYLLGQAIIEKAKSLQASAIYLESNSVLTPALRLYRKLGFVDALGYASPYQRCNVQMELIL